MPPGWGWEGGEGFFKKWIHTEYLWIFGNQISKFNRQRKNLKPIRAIEAEK